MTKFIFFKLYVCLVHRLYKESGSSMMNEKRIKFDMLLFTIEWYFHEVTKGSHKFFTGVKNKIYFLKLKFKWRFGGNKGTFW